MNFTVKSPESQGKLRKHSGAKIQLPEVSGRYISANSANWARPGYHHLSYRPSEGQDPNLIFSGTCLSLGDSGLPLRENQNNDSGAGTCCYQWSGRKDATESSGYPVNSANRARLSPRHVSFRPSEAPCRNLIFSGTCLSQGDSGLPLWGNRNDSFGVATCCALADWLKKCNIAELNG